MKKTLPVIFIAGPTALGKTHLAMQLADTQDVDLISVDAAQVYRGMDIGTAKLTQDEKAQYPHQLVDIRDPSETYDVAQFIKDAMASIEMAHQHHRIPVLVGGSMFYFSALANGVSDLPTADEGLRAEIGEEAKVIGWSQMHASLQSIDPLIAKQINNTDQQRIQRALEIYALTGEKPTEVMQRYVPQKLNYPLLKFNLYHPDRKVLHQRIGERFAQMLEQGLIEEVSTLRSRGDLSLDHSSMRCVGYRQIWLFLDGQIDEQAMIDQSTAATRQLAKRQLTWLRNQSGQIWLNSTDDSNAKIITKFIAPYFNAIKAS